MTIEINYSKTQLRRVQFKLMWSGSKEELISDLACSSAFHHSTDKRID